MLRLGLALALALGLTLPPAAFAGAGSGTRFEVTVTSNAAPGPVTVVTSVMGDAIRTESTAGGVTTVVITTGGMTYLLNDSLMLAQATPVRSPGDNLPQSQAKYWALADPTQVTPSRLPGLFQELGARSLGTDTLEGRQVEAWALSIPADVEFPLNNFRLYLDPKISRPVRMDFQRDKSESVQVRFGNSEEGVALDPSLFEVPEGYRIVEYEW
ncbi:MAG TPA: hypothetical protein VEI97_00690 [bacterium]|nr:hypothetical protein [bacterium]